MSIYRILKQIICARSIHGLNHRCITILGSQITRKDNFNGPIHSKLNCTKNRTECMLDSLSELRSSLCETRLEWTFLRPALLPVKTAQFTQFFPAGMT